MLIALHRLQLAHRPQLRAIHAGDTDPPVAGWARVVFAAILTAVLGTFVIVFRPDASALAERLHRTMERMQSWFAWVF